MKNRCAAALVLAFSLFVFPVFAAQDKSAAGEKPATATTTAATSSTTTSTAEQKAPDQKSAADRGPIRVGVGTDGSEMVGVGLGGDQWSADFGVGGRRGHGGGGGGPQTSGQAPSALQSTSSYSMSP